MYFILQECTVLRKAACHVMISRTREAFDKLQEIPNSVPPEVKHQTLKHQYAQYVGCNLKFRELFCCFICLKRHKGKFFLRNGYPTWDNVLKHVRDVHRRYDALLSCPYCPKKMNSSSNMYKHVRNIHLHPKTIYTCRICDR